MTRHLSLSYYGRLVRSISLKKELTLITVCLCLIGRLAAQSDLTLVNQFDRSNGLPSNTIYCVEEDDRGFMWFGSDQGLIRFDGVDFTKYGLEEGLPDVDILNFFKDSKGRIWFYTLNGQFGYVENDRVYNSWDHAAFRDANFNSRITSIREYKGNMFISSHHHGFVVLDSTMETVYQHKSTDSELTTAHYLHFIEDNFYYVQLLTSSLSYRPKLVISSRNAEEFLKGSPLFEEVYEFEELGQLSYLFSIDHKIAALDRKRYKHHAFTVDTQSGKTSTIPLRGFVTYNVACAFDEILLLTDRGIKSFDKSSMSVREKPKVDYPDLLEVTGLKARGNGELWITTLDGGIYYYARPKVRRILGKAEGVSTVQGLSVQGDSLLHIVYDHQLGQLSNDLVLETKIQLPKRSGIKEVETDREGRSVVLSYNYLRTSENVQRVSSYAILNDGVLVQIDKNNLKISGLNIDPVFEMKGWTNMSKLFDFTFLSKHELLLANSHDAVLVDLAEKEAKKVTGFEHVRVSKFGKDKFGNLWFSSFNDGLFRIPSASLTKFISEKSIDKYRVLDRNYTNIEIIEGVLYASSTSGLDRIAIDSQGIKSLAYISSYHGLGNSKINDIAFMNGRVYVAQDNGLYAFDHNESFTDSAVYSVIVDEVTTLDSVIKSYNFSDLRLPHDVGLIQITSKALDYAAEGRFEYAFRIHEDDAWTATPTNVVSFSNLPPDEYSFQIKARTLNGKWSAPGRVNFVIVPASWQTWWFRTVLAIVSFAIISFVSSIIVRNEERKKRLKKDKMVSDLKALKAQINPHFLFNSLSSINSFILENHSELAESYLTKYSRLMRKILDHSDRQTVSFYEEKEAIELYISLEQLRLPEAFSFLFDLDEEIDFEVLKMPSMIIQPLLENAIWHGIQPSDRKGKITLSMKKRGELVEVCVKDNGVGFEHSPESLAPHGLSLIQERIKIINKIQNVDTKFEIASNANGTTIMFSYPIALD